MLPTGTILQGRYRIVGPRGRGGMGTVYLAEALMLGRTCAVKEMQEPVLDDEAERDAFAAAFHNEARLLASLDHPGLPRVHDFFREGGPRGRYYLVMDFVDGDTLEQIAEEHGGRVPSDIACAWMESILDVLEYLHSRRPPIVLCDLKPENVMRAVNGRLVLVDFGIARLFSAGTLTRPLPGNFGSPGYAAPEQYAGPRASTPDARTDLYGLGATAWRLLTGSPPPEASARAAGAPLPRLREIDPSIPPALDDTVDRMLRLSMAERPTGVASVRLLLKRAQAPLRVAQQQRSAPEAAEAHRQEPADRAHPPSREERVAMLLAMRRPPRYRDDSRLEVPESLRIPTPRRRWAGGRRMTAAAAALGALLLVLALDLLPTSFVEHTFAGEPARQRVLVEEPLEEPSDPPPAAPRPSVAAAPSTPSVPGPPAATPTPRPSTRPESALIDAGQRMLDQGRNVEAASFFRRAANLAPSLPAARNGLKTALEHEARVAAAAGEHERAVPLFEAALRVDMRDANLWDDLGLSLDWLQRSSDSVRAYEEAVRIRPAEPTFLAHLGSAYAHRGDTARGVALCGKAAELAPRNTAVLNDLALASAAAGNRDAAEKAWRAALEVNPDDGILWGNLGHMYFESADTINARMCYERALQLTPMQPLVRQRLESLD